MLRVAVTVIAALAAATALGMLAPAVSGRSIPMFVLALFALGIWLLGWYALAVHRRRARRRMLDMRDSALW